MTKKRGRTPKSALFENAIMQLINNEGTGKKTISITLPESLITDLDFIANEIAGGNRSLVCEKGLFEFAAACKSYIEQEKSKTKDDPEK